MPAGDEDAAERGEHRGRHRHDRGDPADADALERGEPVRREGPHLPPELGALEQQDRTGHRHRGNDDREDALVGDGGPCHEHRTVTDRAGQALRVTSLPQRERGPDHDRGAERRDQQDVERLAGQRPEHESFEEETDHADECDHDDSQE